MSAATSPGTRRNSCGPVRWSRNRVRLCWTDGCVITVTPFKSSVGKGRRQEIKLPRLKFRRLHAEVHLDHTSLALAEKPQDIGKLEALLELNEVGIGYAAETLGTVD